MFCVLELHIIVIHAELFMCINFIIVDTPHVWSNLTTNHSAQIMTSASESSKKIVPNCSYSYSEIKLVQFYLVMGNKKPRGIECFSSSLSTLLISD